MNRIDFLRNKYNVSSTEDLDLIHTELTNGGVGVNTITDKLGKDVENILVMYYDETIHTKRTKTKRYYFFSNELFKYFLDADPTTNSMYIQWIINTAVKLIGDASEFKRLAFEDLDTVKEDLILFDGNKRKKKFKNLARTNYGLKGITDPTNINEYKSFVQLSYSVFAYKGVVHPGELYKTLVGVVNSGHGLMPVSDDKFTVFIPLNKQVSELFSFTRWCTARPGNSNYKTYVDKSWGKKKSKLIIFIKNEIFNDETITGGIYQLHVESSQFMDISDNKYTNFKNDFLDKSLALKNFMFEYMGDGYNNSGVYVDKYLKYIKEFGLSDILFNQLNDDRLGISFKNISFNNVLEFGRFQYLESLFMEKCGINEISLDLFNLDRLVLVSLPYNNIKKLPTSIGNARKMAMLNLVGNPLETVPDEIKYLDRTNGGNLKRLSICKLTPSNVVNEIKMKLPSVELIILTNN